MVVDRNMRQSSLRLNTMFNDLYKPLKIFITYLYKLL